MGEPIKIESFNKDNIFIDDIYAHADFSSSFGISKEGVLYGWGDNRNNRIIQNNIEN